MNYLPYYFQQGLVGYWTMDQIGLYDPEVKDYTPYSNNLSYNSSIHTSDANGNFSGAIYVMEKMYRTMNTDIFYSKSATINLWAKKDSEGKVLFMSFGKELSEEVLFGVRFYSSSVRLTLKDYGTLSLNTYFDFDSTWRMYTLVIDDENKILTLYQNGIKTNFLEYKTIGAGVIDYDGNDIQIGDGKSFYIDETRFYNKAVEVNDLLLLHSTGVDHSTFKCELESPEPNYKTGTFNFNWSGIIEFKNRLNSNFSEVYYKINDIDYIKYEGSFEIIEDNSTLTCYQKAMLDIFVDSSEVQFLYNWSSGNIITQTANSNNEAFILNGNILCSKNEVDKISFKGEDIEFEFVNKRYFYTYKLFKDVLPSIDNYLLIKYKDEEFFDVSVTQNQLVSVGDNNAFFG